MRRQIIKDLSTMIYATTTCNSSAFLTRISKRRRAMLREVREREREEGKRTSLDVPADVSRLSEVCGPSDDDEQGVFVEAEVEVCGRGAPRLLPDLPLRHPAGRHVGEPAVGM